MRPTKYYIVFFVACAAILSINPCASGQTLDTLTFGNTTSESAHHLATDFPPVTNVVAAGGSPAPTDPSSTPPSDTVTGGLGMSARRLLPRTPNSDIYGGEISFTMTVDPANQNYFTIKLWGSDSANSSTQTSFCPLMFVLNCNGKELGWRTAGDNQEILWNVGTGWCPNRFVYRTVALPLNMTQGQTSVTLKIRSLGWIYPYSSIYYGASSGPSYQNLMNGPSLSLYSAYTHTGVYLDASNETQGTAPPMGPLRTYPTQTDVMTNWNNNLNTEIATYLAATPGSLSADHIDFLAQCYGVNTTTAYQNSAVLNQEINAIDASVAAYSAAPTTYMASFGNYSWGGYFGPVGDAIRLLWPQLNTGGIMSTTVNYGGTLGTTTRTQAWSAALRASIDYGRYNRNGVTNQALDCDGSIYKANRGLELVDPANAIEESQALRYIREASGATPWLGSDQRTGGTDGLGGGPVPTPGTAPNGPNWYMTTSKGTSKETSSTNCPLGFAGSDYGEVGSVIYDLGVLANNDPAVLAQGLKVLRARANFRVFGTDSSGYPIVYGENATGVRNDYEYNSHVAYLARTSYGATELEPASYGASVIGSDLLGYLQQEVSDGQFFSQLQNNGDLSGTPYIPAFVQSFMAQPQTGVLLPETTGQPDFAWSDEENTVIAAKHGSGASEERFYVNLSWRSPGMDRIAKVLRTTNTMANVAEVMCDDIQYQPSGVMYTESSAVDPDKTPPDNPVNAYAGVSWPEALRPDLTTVPPYNAEAGRAWGYTLRYANWLVGINSNPGRTYTMKLPVGFTSAVDLVSGQTLTAPIIIQPKSSVVFYLNTTADSNPTPCSPIYLTGVGTQTQVVLNWWATTNTTSYDVQRATSLAGPYANIATGITGTTYTDTSVVAGGSYYYQIVAVNSAGVSNPSPVFATGAGLPPPWVNTDIGAVGFAGSSTYLSGVFTVNGSGGDIGYINDAFQYAYMPLTGDGTITAQVTSTTSSHYSYYIGKVGIMMRNSVATTGAQQISLLGYSGNPVVVESRLNAGGDTTYPTFSQTLPCWLRLTRTGNVFTAYTSPDGSNWTLLDTVTIAMNSTIDVGLVACSRNNPYLVTATFANVSVTGWTPPSATVTPTPTPTQPTSTPTPATPSPTHTPTPTPFATPSPTPTLSPTTTPTPVPTSSPHPSPTPTPTLSPTTTPTPLPTSAPLPSPTPTPTPIPTATPNPTPRSTPTPTPRRHRRPKQSQPKQNPTDPRQFPTPAPDEDENWFLQAVQKTGKNVT